MGDKIYKQKYVNKTILRGRVGKDPVYRKITSGDPVVNFSVATNSGSHVEWHPIVAFDGLANKVKDELGQGDWVHVEGEIKTRDYLSSEDKIQGRKARKIREIIATDIFLLEKSFSKSESNNDNDNDDDDSEGVSYTPIDSSLDEDFQNNKPETADFISDFKLPNCV